MEFNESRVSGALLATLVALSGSCRADDATSNMSVGLYQSAWFLPSLTVNEDPICDTVITSVQTYFLSTRPWNDIDLASFEKISGPFSSRDTADSTVQVTKDDPRQFILTENNKPPLFAYFMNLGGCGGACETERVVVSDSKQSPMSGVRDELPASTPASPQWTLYRDDSGHFYVMGVIDTQLQTYRVVSPDRWKLSCEVALEPAHLSETEDLNVQAVVESVEALNAATNRISQGYGSCGSMATGWRWKGVIKTGLYQALHRPWALNEPQRLYPSENSFGDYTRIEKSLRLWSLGGIAEYRAFEQYQMQLAKTTKQLATFYENTFGWPASQAEEIARQAPVNAISRGFGFYSYDPYPDPAEEDLRQLILEHKPIEEIRAAEFNIDNVILSSKDSILNVAIEYPQALDYLLKKGISPNAANEFGKTPLMYAAQYNQIESAKLLLAAGADPNAVTVAPEDTCAYEIQTTNMTPLHYAARYASLPLVKLLVDHGAVTFQQSSNPLRPAEFPINWLHRYSVSSGSEEANKNISAEEIPLAADALHVPDPTERSRLATKMVIRAEAAYAKGNVESAYRQLKIALAAQPDNQKAVMDLPLIALKSGHVGPAIEAANEATKTLKSPSSLAAAWFNKGLICEDKAAREITYDQNRCDYDWIRPFVRAWQLESTFARESKIRSIMMKEGPGACITYRNGTLDKRYIIGWDSRAWSAGEQYRHVQRIYAFHKADEAINAKSIQWHVKFVGQEPTIVTPKIVDHFVLGKDAVTVLEGDNYGQAPIIDGQTCELN